MSCVFCEIIKDNKEQVTLIAKTLLEHEQITAEEIDYLLEHRHLQRDEAPAAQPSEPVSNTQESSQSEIQIVVPQDDHREGEGE